MDAPAVQVTGQAIAPSVEAGKGIYKWLKRKYHYVRHISQNFKELELANRRLRDAKRRVKKELNDNRSKKEITSECDTWLQRVKEIRAEIKTLTHKYENKPSTCLCGLWPFCTLLKLGKSVVKKTKEANDLRNEQITIMADKSPTVHRSHRWNNDVRIVHYPSFKNHMETLIDWLKEERFMRICIWGPPGVGKTTLMKTVHGNVCESCQLEYSFWVSLTEESRILEDIQEEILKCLDLRLDEKNGPVQRAEMISKMLKERKYVLFLDEVSSMINLEEAGISYNHKHGKVVFASRDKFIGHTDEDLNVQRLSKEDARKLFWEQVGSDQEKRGEIKRIAEQIIDLCCGMPPIIVLIGKHLARENDPALWRDMKSQLQSPSRQIWQEWEEYYKSFKLVYDKLHADHKTCLLYWAIFPFGQETNRDFIIDCWIAEHLFAWERLWQARDRGHAILRDLTNKSLLEKGEKLGHFKMFVCFQKAASKIANQENDWKLFVENGKRIENEEWLEAKRVSLARISIDPVPEMPKCSGMLTLLLHENRLMEFPEQFFKYMHGLQVLCISESKINGLPSSISKLTHLKGLVLDSCHMLVQLPHQIGDLQSLEIFVCHTGIYSLPSEIGQLGKLKCFRVSFREVANKNHGTAGNNMTGNSSNCNHNGTEKRIIPSGIIKKLSKLEELIIDVDPDIKGWNRNAEVIAREITELKELTHLHFCFPYITSLEHFIENSESWKRNGEIQEFEGFRSFNILVGEQGNSSTLDFNVLECSAVKHLKFSTGVTFPAAVSNVLQQAKSFELVGHKTARSLTDNFSADTLQELEACIVEECNTMESIVDSNNNITGGVVFQNLEKLHMKKLPNLVTIWNGTIPLDSKSFQALTTLTLKECHHIKVVFSLEMVRKLSKLQNLQVQNCTMIEKIIDTESTIDEFLVLPEVLPELKNFQLSGLRNLSSVCKVSIQWRSLEIIQIETCEVLTSLPCIVENAPKLREIQCHEDWWHQQSWPNNEIEDREYQKYLPYPLTRRKSRVTTMIASASDNQA
ncbi:hypothetical protein PTKIN_Ptkin09bG0276400 [Pterospermum kingtungense]